ncbi:MAG: hypothetical protein ISS56_09750 [Anaerolineae bacterium]|nr:hypothetical protein [Anaerolineae bacterium]
MRRESRPEKASIEEYNLKIGESALLERSSSGRQVYVVYAGMPSERVFSLAVTSSPDGHTGGYNLYLPATQRIVQLEESRLDVLHVTPEGIVFRCAGSRGE